MSIKDCGQHGHSRKKLYRRIFSGVVISVVIILVVVLLVWAILRPTKPKFILQDATVYGFNVSAPNLLSSNFQVTLSSRNPNHKVAVVYDSLAVYAAYRGQQITLRTALPRTYQPTNEVNVWSPFVYGTNVPVAPYNAASLSQDHSAGSVMLVVKIDGRVRWKVGTFVSGHYHLHVNCPAVITFGSRSTGIVVGNAVKYQLVQSCSVSV